MPGTGTGIAGRVREADGPPALYACAPPLPVRRCPRALVAPPRAGSFVQGGELRLR